MEQPEPAAQAEPEPARQPLLAAEIDDVQLAAGRQPAERAGRALPASPGSSTGCRTRRCARSPARRTAGRDRRSWRRRGPAGCRRARPSRSTTLARRLEHLGGDVDAEEVHVGIGARRHDQIARGAAADLEHAAAGRRRQPMDQPVAAQQVVFAREVVDVALAAIDPVHQLGGRGDDRVIASAFEAHRDGSRHRSPSGRARSAPATASAS